MTSFTSLGIGSGLPLNTLVEAFLDAERIPTEARLQTQQESLELELSGVGSFKSSLSTFQTTLDKLTAEDAFSQQVVTSSNENISVTTNGFASNGEFDVSVQQLAQGSRLKSASFSSSSDTVGSGTLTFSAGANTFDVTVGAGDDLSAVRDQINAQAENFGVTANILNTDAGSFLIFNSSVTGSANNLTVTSSDPSLDNISTNNTNELTAQDAIITVNNNTITKDTNEFKNVIEDVTITANKVTSTSATPEDSKIVITQDSENGSELINEFINGFNALTEQLIGLGAPKLGRLAFDPNVRQVRQQLSDIVLGSVAGAGGVDSLQALGIELNTDGKLEISSFSSENIQSGQARLDDALANNLEEVGKLFADADGIATKMSDLAESYIKYDGVLTLREESLNERISDVEQDYLDLDERMLYFEETLIKQFTALDSAVAGFNATGSFVQSALGNLSANTQDS